MNQSQFSEYHIAYKSLIQFGHFPIFNNFVFPFIIPSTLDPKLPCKHESQEQIALFHCNNFWTIYLDQPILQEPNMRLRICCACLIFLRLNLFCSCCLFVKCQSKAKPCLTLFPVHHLNILIIFPQGLVRCVQ